MAKDKETSEPYVPSDTGDASVVAARVQVIEQITQLRGLFERFPIPEPERLEAVLGQPATKAEWADDGRIIVLVEMSFDAFAMHAEDDFGEKETEEGQTEATEHVQERSPYASVSAAFVVIYQISDGPKPSDEDIEAFGQANGVFNITPYWREFLNSSLVRAGLPAFLTPVMKLGQFTADESGAD
jgi:hypothetical protein